MDVYDQTPEFGYDMLTFFSLVRPTVPRWDKNFLSLGNSVNLSALANAAYDLKIMRLLHYTTQMLADMYKDVPVENFMERFKVRKDTYTQYDDDEIELLSIDYSRSSEIGFNYNKYQ